MDEALAAVGFELMYSGGKRSAVRLAVFGAAALLTLGGCSKNTTPEAEQKTKLQEAGQARQAENSPSGTPIPAQQGEAEGK